MLKKTVFFLVCCSVYFVFIYNSGWLYSIKYKFRLILYFVKYILYLCKKN